MQNYNIGRNKGIPYAGEKKSQARRHLFSKRYTNYIAEYHHTQYGLPWCIGVDQFDYILKCGLQHHHSLFEIGFGCLRFGIHAIKYLDINNYYGIEPDKESFLAASKYEIPVNLLENKNPNIFNISIFDVQEMKKCIKKKMDYIFVFGVLNHLTEEGKIILFNNIGNYIKEDGFIIMGGGEYIFIPNEIQNKLGLVLNRKDAVKSKFINVFLKWCQYRKSS